MTILRKFLKKKQSKTGTKTSDIQDFPTYEGNAGKYLKINDDETAPEVVDIDTAIQDIVGAMGEDTDTINFSYDSITHKITNEVIDDSITKEKINSDVAGTNLSQDTEGSLKLADVVLIGTSLFAPCVATNALTVNGLITATCISTNALVIGGLLQSGTNTGDETTSTIKSKLGAAATGADGYLTLSDWNTFNGKEPAITKNTAFNKNYETDTGNIKMAGSVSVGSLDTIPKSDHVHPSDTTKLNLSGGTMTGVLTNNSGVNAFFRLNQELVLQKLKSIVSSVSNIKRVIFFDETGAVTTLKDRSINLLDATLSANASTLTPEITETCRSLNLTSYYTSAC